MNRNSNARFELAPQVQIERSTFDRSVNVKTSFNVGDLIPFYLDEVLPGDTFEIDTSKVCRLQTLLTPVMDNLYLDVYYFFVPNRLVWNHWREFCGENTAGAWAQTVEYTVPKLKAPSGGWNVGTIADYFGIPTGVANLKVNALPFRAYALICDQWFRDENLSQPLAIPLTDTDVTGVNSGTFVTDVAKGGKPYTAAKYHDYFTSCLPSPQKGPDVVLPLGSVAPVVTNSVENAFGDYPLYDVNNELAYPLKMRSYDWDAISANTNLAVKGSNSSLANSTNSVTVGTDSLIPSNLVANLQNATAATINELRLAFQIQRLYEKDARGGTRYIELIKSHFGVNSPDARLQRTEYLGGNRIPFNIEQVTQTSSTDTTSPLGTNAGWSQTADYSNDVYKSFTEHGFIIGIACARYDHTYQQGLECMWSRNTRFDYYWPALAHIGEKAVFNREIFAQGTSTDDEVFGYQEAWAEYRYKPNYITGEMRSAFAQSLDFWHFADNYASLPYLSDSWIREDKTNVDRTLAVTSSTSNQVFADILVDCKVTRPMPLYSVPGLIDHF